MITSSEARNRGAASFKPTPWFCRPLSRDLGGDLDALMPAASLTATPYHSSAVHPPIPCPRLILPSGSRLGPLFGRWNHYQSLPWAYMFQQTLTTGFLFPSPREPLLLSADWPRGNVLEAAHNASETGRTSECLHYRMQRDPLTIPSHRTQRVGGPQHRLLCKDEMGRWSNRHPECLRPWTHPHDNPRPSRDTIRMILTPRHATAAWLFVVIPRSHLQMTSIAGHGHGRTQDGHMATLLTTPAVGRCRHLHSSPGQDAYCRFSTPGNCQPPPAHGRSGERNGDIQAHSVAEPAWMSHRDPAQQPAVASVPDNTGIPRATSEQYSHSVCTSTAYSHSTP